MSDKRNLIEPAITALGKDWDAVASSFEDAHSAVKWLMERRGMFGGETPLSYIKSGGDKRNSVMATLAGMDGIRIG